MSINLTTAAITFFDNMVKHAYQEETSLRATVRSKTGVTGSTARFRTMGKGTATPRVPQTDVTPMNVSHGYQDATLEDWNAPEYTDIFDQAETNINEQSELAYTIAAAITRRETQLILDALDAASTSLTVSTNIGGTASDMNTAKFRQTKKLADANNWPSGPGMRTFLMHANSLYAMLGDSDANTFDKNVVKALVDGDLSRWLGWDIITIGDMDEGGIPKPSTRTSYAYNSGMRGAVGIAVGLDRRTEVNYIPEKTSWLANGLFKAGATYITASGIIEISSTEA